MHALLLAFAELNITLWSLFDVSKNGISVLKKGLNQLSDVPRKKKKEKNGSKFDFNTGFKLYTD